MRSLLLAILVISGVTGAAIAADEIVQPEPAGFSWSGAYLGVHGGYNHFSDDFQDPVPPFFGSLDGNGGLLGVHAGYNYQVNRFVLGVEADIGIVTGDAEAVADNTPAVFGRAEANWEASLRARAGVANGSMLFYATGGVAWASYDFDYTFPAPVFGIGDQFSETLTGYTVGAGVEYAATAKWTVRAEYRWSDYGTAEGGIVNCCAPAPNSQQHDLSTHTVRLGLSRLF